MSTSKKIKQKSFWKRPEGVTGAIFLGGITIGLGVLVIAALPALAELARNTATLAVMLLALGAIVYMFLDPRARTLIWYSYKSLMRWITSLFVELDPIAILKNYIDELKNNLHNMRRQIGKLRGQMHILQEVIHNNKKSIENNLELASKAREHERTKEIILKTRRAGRLRDSNLRLEDLYRKMEMMYRVLTKMYENSQILMEDLQDQVMIKEQEQKAIHASNSAMKSAMSILKGDPDQRAMFDAAMEAMKEDVAEKVSEMEQFMELSANVMDRIDLQNGIFEEEGLKMLEKWEKAGQSRLLGAEKELLMLKTNNEEDVLDLNAPLKEPIREPGHRNQYDSFFELD